jgi:molecular chaperone GrpE
VTEVPVLPGAEFDPAVHEAMSQQESPEVADGHVLRVVRRGFRLRERLLRPASVVVAKAPATKTAES